MDADSDPSSTPAMVPPAVTIVSQDQLTPAVSAQLGYTYCTRPVQPAVSVSSAAISLVPPAMSVVSPAVSVTTVVPPAISVTTECSNMCNPEPFQHLKMNLYQLLLRHSACQFHFFMVAYTFHCLELTCMLDSRWSYAIVKLHQHPKFQRQHAALEDRQYHHAVTKVTWFTCAVLRQGFVNHNSQYLIFRCETLGVFFGNLLSRLLKFSTNFNNFNNRPQQYARGCWAKNKIVADGNDAKMAQPKYDY